MARITSKGQVTIPKQVRDRLGLAAGTQVVFELDTDGVRLRKLPPGTALDRWTGVLELPQEVDDFIGDLRGEP
ncbi:MAG TPA: AbrB/MazE/SpoVT family DNA-binding domain-containing protein [Thermoanaerobaculia bacterium]|nr:AbrB/MazE/SpoVT family DNA-binding domain-containing protein [Thermoanaerobaculia bacterium]